jgi:hypothetical protein
MTVLSGELASNMPNMKDEQIIKKIIDILKGLFPEEVSRLDCHATHNLRICSKVDQGVGSSDLLFSISKYWKWSSR